MTKTGRCYLYKKTNSPVNGREFVLGISPGTPKELAPAPTRVRGARHTYQPTNSRRNPPPL